MPSIRTSLAICAAICAYALSIVLAFGIQCQYFSIACDPPISDVLAWVPRAVGSAFVGFVIFAVLVVPLAHLRWTANLFDAPWSIAVTCAAFGTIPMVWGCSSGGCSLSTWIEELGKGFFAGAVAGYCYVVVAKASNISQHADALKRAAERAR